jgi:dTDP-4-amino-4,6-dideoxygalactose transaminase
MKIPFVDLKAQYQSIKPEMDEMISNIINETAFIGGKYVKEFETKFASLYGVKHVISCANGTDSLYIIMRSLGKLAQPLYLLIAMNNLLAWMLPN